MHTATSSSPYYYFSFFFLIFSLPWLLIMTVGGLKRGEPRYHPETQYSKSDGPYYRQMKEHTKKTVLSDGGFEIDYPHTNLVEDGFDMRTMKHSLSQSRKCSEARLSTSPMLLSLLRKI